MSKIITITGPESSGKTTLAKALAAALSGIYIPEFSRNYLEQLGRAYVPDDIIEISKGQLMLEQDLYDENAPVFICDTSQLVLKIWMEYKYGFAAPEVEKAFLEHATDLYVLCKPDLPWEPDPLRENPNDRDVLFNLYHEALVKYKKPFVVISGLGEQERLEKAKELIVDFFN